MSVEVKPGDIFVVDKSDLEKSKGLCKIMIVMEEPTKENVYFVSNAAPAVKVMAYENDKNGFKERYIWLSVLTDGGMLKL